MSREMKDSGIAWIGEIPEHWEVVRTKNIFCIGKELVGTDSVNTQLLSLTTKGIKQVEIGSTSGKVPDSYDTYQIVHKNNLVFCLFDLDCSAVFSGVSSYDGMISPAYKVLSMQDGYYPQFYGYWFDYIFDGRKYKYLSKNIRYSLTYDEFAALGIIAPSYIEQQKIAEFLDRKCAKIDELVALQEKMIEELKAYKQSVITEAVTKGLNPNAPMKDSGIEWIGEIPEHWDCFKFWKVNYIRGRLGWKGLKAEEYQEVGYPFLSAYNIIQDKLDWSDVNYITQERYDESPEIKLNIGDILIVKDGAGIGKCARVDNLPKGEATVNSSLAVITPNNQLFYKFEYYYLLSTPFQYVIWFLKIGMGVPHLTQENMRDIIFVYPSLSEQQQIADYLDKKCAKIDELVAVKQQKIETLKEYKKSLIYEYVTGKKEVI